MFEMLKQNKIELVSDKSKWKYKIIELRGRPKKCPQNVQDLCRV